MSRVLLIEDDSETTRAVGATLRADGHEVLTVSSSPEALEYLSQQPAEFVVVPLTLHESLNLAALRHLCGNGAVPVVVMTALSTTALAGQPSQPAGGSAHHTPRAEPHAAKRWARAVVPIVDSPKDPRTIVEWSRWIAVSPGALRNWCSTAGIGSRRSLVLGRIVRAVILSEGGRHRPENLLDVVDRRTLRGLIKFAGFDPQAEFPTDVEAFLDRQTLVRDSTALEQVRSLLDRRALMHATRTIETSTG